MRAKVNNLFIIKFNYHWLVICFFIGAQLFLFEAIAASSKKSDFNQLVTKSDVIVFGKCTAVESEWRKNKIYSNATIQVESEIKGSAPPIIQVEYMGGTAMHPTLNIPVTMNVSTGVDFSAGDEAVLMLQQLPGKRYRVVDIARGKIAVDTDSTTGEKIVRSGVKKIKSTPSAKDNSTVLSSKQMNLQEFTKFIHSRMRLKKEKKKQ